MNKRLLLYFAAMILIACGIGCTAGDGSQTPAPFTSLTVVAGTGGEIGEPFGIAFGNGELFVSDGDGGRIMRVGPEGVTEFAAGLMTPSGIAFDAAGELIVADSGSNSIKKIRADGSVVTIAGTGARGSADGGAASATFSSPVGIAVSPGGAIYVADTYNDRIRVIENGMVRTAAGGERGLADGSGSTARFDTPLGIAVWEDRMLVADAGNRRIRVIEPDGTVWTLAGDGTSRPRDGTLPDSAFSRPTAVTVAENGVIFVADGDSIRAIGARVFPFVETLGAARRGESTGMQFAAELSRPSGIAAAPDGSLSFSDSDNGLIRKFGVGEAPPGGTSDAGPEIVSAEEFRRQAPARWPYDPPTAPRDVAGTLGEIRGRISDEDSPVWFHNGLDIAGAYGETARFIRDEKVLDPIAAENFATLRELLRMPTLGYIHIRLGRSAADEPLPDDRFLFGRGPDGRLNGIRVPRGSTFRAGEPIGTLNALNHVHLIAGRQGAEMNALAALELPGVADTIHPTIENVTLFDSQGSAMETKGPASRISISGKVRVVVRAFDRMDGNPERRKLGVYRLGYSIYPASGPIAETDWTIVFDRMPPNDAVRTVYADGSNSGAYGGTVFNYIVTNRLSRFEASEGHIDTSVLAPGPYTITVAAADLFGNTTKRDIHVEIVRGS